MRVSLHKAEVAALGLVIALGLVALPQPFGWDQALFALGARSLSEGGALYRDFWDVKQPGIFLFYRAGGALFGLHEAGVHLFELLWNVALAVLAIVAVRRESRTGAGPPAAAIFTAGVLYAVLGDAHLTQVETVAGLPLLVCAFAANEASRPGRPSLLPATISGVAGGVATLLKLTLLPIVGAFWLAALLWALRDPAPRRGGRVAISAAGVAIGLAIPWLAVGAWLAARGTLAEAWWAWTRYPLYVLARQEGFRIFRLANGLAWYVGHWAPLLGLGAIGLVLGLRRGSRLAAQMGLWLAVGFATILVQRWSYWEYHFVLLAVPAGVLAAFGLDALHEALAPWMGEGDRAGRRLALTLGVVALFAWPIGIAGMRVLVLARHDFALTQRGRIAFQEFMSSGDSQGDIRREVAFLKEPGAVPGSLYVLGNPLYNWISGRPPGAPRHGAVLAGDTTREQWEATTAHMLTHPPAYVVFERGYFERGEERPEAASFSAWLHANYVRHRDSENATWWVRRE